MQFARLLNYIFIFVAYFAARKNPQNSAANSRRHYAVSFAELAVISCSLSTTPPPAARPILHPPGGTYAHRVASSASGPVYGVNLPKHFCSEHANEPKAVKGYGFAMAVVVVVLLLLLLVLLLLLDFPPTAATAAETRPNEPHAGNGTCKNKDFVGFKLIYINV